MMPQLIIGILILLAILGTLFMALFVISAVMLSSEISATERQNGTNDDET